MSVLLLAAYSLGSLIGCHGGDSDTVTAGDTTPRDTGVWNPDQDDTDAGDTDTDASVETTWRWIDVPIPTGYQPLAIRSPLGVVRAAGNDEIYVATEDGSRVDIIRPTYLTGTGASYCVGGKGTPADCTDGTLVTSGRILTTASTAMCLDDAHDRLDLVKTDGSVERVATSWTGPNWMQYDRVFSTVTAPADVGTPSITACAATSDGWLFGESEHLVRAESSGTSWDEVELTSLSSEARQIVTLADRVVVLTVDGHLPTFTTQTLTPGADLAAAGDVGAISLDASAGALWATRPASAEVTRFSFAATDFGKAWDVPLGATPVAITTDPRSGLAYVLVDDARDKWQLLLVDAERGVLATRPLDFTPTALAPAGNIDDAVVFEHTDKGLVPHVYSPRPTPDDRLPLRAFVMTTLEQPFDDATMDCATFDAYVAQLRSNLAEVEPIGLPFAVGVTLEFVSKSQECGDDAVLQEMYDAGFVLGYMVHDKPCFSCTDGAVTDEHPALCDVKDPDYQPPRSADACWPSNPAYCDRGDQACWLAYVGAQELQADAVIPGGAKFVMGADRHVLWDWDPIAGYRDLPRADGTTGYDTTLFAAQWVYPDITGADDPRAKDPAPRSPERLGAAWHVADAQRFEADDTSSGLVYLPGNSVTIQRTFEWQTSWLTSVQMIDEKIPTPVTSGDFDVVTGLIRQAAAHREAGKIGTFYFHISDLTAWSLRSDREGETAPADLLSAWKDDVDARWGPAGEDIMEWTPMTDARAEVK